MGSQRYSAGFAYDPRLCKNQRHKMVQPYSPKDAVFGSLDLSWLVDAVSKHSCDVKLRRPGPGHVSVEVVSTFQVLKRWNQWQFPHIFLSPRCSAREKQFPTMFVMFLTFHAYTLYDLFGSPHLKTYIGHLTPRTLFMCVYLIIFWDPTFKRNISIQILQ